MRFGQKGMSLVEMVMVLGVLAIIGTISMHMNGLLGGIQNRAKSVSGVLELDNAIRTNFRTPEICKKLLKDLGFKNGQVLLSEKDKILTSTELLGLRNRAGQVYLQKGLDGEISPSARYENIRVQDFFLKVIQVDANDRVIGENMLYSLNISGHVALIVSPVRCKMKGDKCLEPKPLDTISFNIPFSITGTVANENAIDPSKVNVQCGYLFPTPPTVQYNAIKRRVFQRLCGEMGYDPYCRSARVENSSDCWDVNIVYGADRKPHFQCSNIEP